MRQINFIINKIKAIHRSRKEFKEELTEEQKRRLEICKLCVHNSENNVMGIRETIMLYLNKLLNRFYGLRVLVESVCMICGCQLVFITGQEDVENKCKLGKW